jgi:hypothetical protein
MENVPSREATRVMDGGRGDLRSALGHVGVDAIAQAHNGASNPFSERFPNRLFINASQHSFSIGRARLREVAAVVSKTGPNGTLIPVDLGPLAPSRRLHDDDGTRLDSTHPLRTPKS